MKTCYKKPVHWYLHYVFFGSIQSKMWTENYIVIVLRLLAQACFFLLQELAFYKNKYVYLSSLSGRMPNLRELYLSNNKLGAQNKVDWKWLLGPQVSAKSVIYTSIISVKGVFSIIFLHLNQWTTLDEIQCCDSLTLK